MRVRHLSTIVLSALAIFSASCATNDGPVAPPAAKAPTATSKNLLGTLLGAPTTVTPLLRNKALASNITTSTTVGLFGGVIVVPGAGLSIIVPPLAVTKPTTITVTARAGSNVAYDFEPHGIRFNIPLIATQDLHNTHAGPGGIYNPLNLFVGYYPDANNVTSVTELLNVGLTLQNTLATTTIWHFSGYIFAGARDDGNDLY
jgi:hypothetical protein